MQYCLKTEKMFLNYHTEWPFTDFEFIKKKINKKNKKKKIKKKKDHQKIKKKLCRLKVEHIACYGGDFKFIHIR